MPGGGGEQLLSLPDEVPRYPPRRPVEPKAGEQLAAGRIRQLAHGAAVQVHSVEDHQRHQRHAPGAAAGPAAEPVAQRGEVGLVLAVQVDELAVEDGAPAGELIGDRGQLGELGGAVAARAGAHAHAAAVVAKLRAHAVRI